jgi:hypothetical protein
VPELPLLHGAVSAPAINSGTLEGSRAPRAGVSEQSALASHVITAG